jgi:hypothetical protein
MAAAKKKSSHRPDQRPQGARSRTALRKWSDKVMLTKSSLSRKRSARDVARSTLEAAKGELRRMFRVSRP